MLENDLAILLIVSVPVAAILFFLVGHFLAAVGVGTKAQGAFQAGGGALSPQRVEQLKRQRRRSRTVALGIFVFSFIMILSFVVLAVDSSS